MNKTIAAWLENIFGKFAILFMYMSILAALLYLPRVYDLFLKQEKVLNVYVFREIIADEIFAEFEEKTGIHPVVTYYATNEELLAKFKISRGKGYDLILPSDYMVECLREEGLLHKIDKSKIPNAALLDERFMHKYFDPQNDYSLPFCWTPYGIGYDKNEVADDQASDWRLIFERGPAGQERQRISMLNDARESIFLASVYLYQDTSFFTPDRIAAIQNLLTEQKKFIECYTESGAKYLLLSDIVSAAVVPLTRMKEIVDEGKHFGFVLPRQGGLVSIENVAIPVCAKRVDLAHQFIDFLLSKEMGVASFDLYGSLPANKAAYDELKVTYKEDASLFFPDDEMIKTLHLINNQIPAPVIEKLWLSVKAA